MPITLEEMWPLFETDKKIENYSVNTLDGYKVQKNMLVRYFGNMDVNDINLLLLKKYLVDKGSHLKPSSLGMRIKFIRTYFRWMCDEGYCQGNPTTKLKSPRLGKRIPKAFNEEEIEMLQEAGKHPIDFALTSFLFSTGCRIGEVQKLNRSDINWENRSCIVLGKGNKQREVYFGVKAKIRLKWYLESRNDDCPALFISQRRPYRRLSIDQLRRITKRVAEKANISNTMYPHKWRHTFAMHMLNKGAPLEAVQDQLGHEDMKTTRIYCQLSGARRKSIHDFYF